MGKNKVETSAVCVNQEGGKYCCKISIVLLIVAFGVCAFYGYSNRSTMKNIECDFVTLKQENQKEIESLKKEVLELKTDMEKKSVVEKQKQRAYSCDEQRKRWKIWVALRKKMESGESFDKELEVFNNAFAGDTEVLAMVGGLAKGVEVVSISENDELIETCKKYLKKIIKLKKINQKKLVEISGYVLSPVNCSNSVSDCSGETI